MNLIYVSKGDVSVYDSQVVALLKYYLDCGIPVTLVEGYKTKREHESLLKKTKILKGCKIIWFQSMPSYSVFIQRSCRYLEKALESCTFNEDTVVHVRGGEMSSLVKRIILKKNINVPILIDVRGVVYEEIKYRLQKLTYIKGFRYRLQKGYFLSLYQSLFKKDNVNIAISSVSPLINAYISEHYPQCNYKKYFHPNIAGTQFSYNENGRIRIRKKYGISADEPVAICSTNGNGIWQKDYLVIQKLVDKGVKVINLSNCDPHIKGCISTKIPFAEMPDYLSSADYAVLWRDNTFMNNSASPSKFSEFAVMGLYVIHNKSVGVAVHYIQETGAGILVDDLSDIEAAVLNIKEIRLHRDTFIKEGRRRFGIEALGPSYIRVYKELLNSKNIHKKKRII